MNKIYVYIGIVFAAFLAFLKAVSMGKAIEQGKQSKAAGKQKDANTDAIIDTEKEYQDAVNSKPDDDYFTK